MRRLLEEGLIEFGEDHTVQPQRRYFLDENMEEGIPSILPYAGSDDARFTAWGLRFDNPKPVEFSAALISWLTSADDLVVDFFAGSGTAGHATLLANSRDGGGRRYLLVQLPERAQNESPTLSEVTKERMRIVARELLKGENREAHADVGFRVFSLRPSNFVVWNSTAGDRADLSEQLKLNVDHVAEGSTQAAMLAELLLKAGFPLTADVQESDFGGVPGYAVADGALLVCLSDSLTIEAVEAMVELHPAMILVLDKGFGGSDELKVNALQTVRARNQREGTDIALRVV